MTTIGPLEMIWERTIVSHLGFYESTFDSSLPRVEGQADETYLRTINKPVFYYQ